MSKELGCAFCNQEDEDYDYLNGITKRAGYTVLGLETSNDSYDSYDTVTIRVNYCPMCGRKLDCEVKEEEKTEEYEMAERLWARDIKSVENFGLKNSDKYADIDWTKIQEIMYNNWNIWNKEMEEDLKK